MTVQKEGELIEGVVVKDSLTTTQHRALPEKTQKRKVKLYNLDVIISVGYRVKSQKAPQIRNE
ncbi:MAG: virulence RhuM family protein [Coriobacteriales bacterium]|nr:virulence RhuM family protein [Coriobacteriales bacterium]